MNRSPWILIVVFITGLIILLLPDNSEPVIRFNKLHGPSMIDIAGLFLMFLSWSVSYVMMIRCWKKVTTRLGKGMIYLLGIFYCIFLLGIGIALLVSSEWILWVCAAAAFMINIIFLIPVFRKA